MTKKRKVESQLYDHNAASAVHRTLNVTNDGRRRRTTSNQVELPPIPASVESISQEDDHLLHDNHIPVDKEDPEALSGVKVKVIPAKRYENSVRQFVMVAWQPQLEL